MHCCHNCGKRARKMSACKRCLHAHFCSLECLRAAWNAHKPVCAAIAADHARKPMVAGRNRFCHGAPRSIALFGQPTSLIRKHLLPTTVTRARPFLCQRPGARAETFLPDALSPDRPGVCHFWLLALLSAFLPPSGTNEEGLQIVCMHLARYVFVYTGHAVPAYLRRRLARCAEAQRIRLEIAGVSLASPLAKKVGPPEDRIAVECSEAAVRTLRYVLVRDHEVLEDSGRGVRPERADAEGVQAVRVQLARALLMGRAASGTDAEAGGEHDLLERRVAEVAKLVVAVGVRGAGLVSTSFGWLMASGECQELLERWMDPVWWRLEGRSNDLVVALNAGFTAHPHVRVKLDALDRATRRRYGRTRSFGAVRTRSFVAGALGSARMSALLARLKPLERRGAAAALVVPLAMLPPELHDWCEWHHQEHLSGAYMALQPGEAQFMDAAGGALRELLAMVVRGDAMYDMLHSRGCQVVDVSAG
jgi:MYND finger